MQMHRNDLTVMVIGSGGREHAICWKLAQSKHVKRILCAPGNGGTAGEKKTTNFDIPVLKFDQLTELAKNEQVDLIVVGPDDPIAAGAVDHFQSHGLRVFGPRQAAARLESSKVFAKEFMVAQRIPTARYLVFEDLKEALNAVQEHPWARVIKADGLALGKGVFVCDSVAEATDALNAIFRERRFGEAGRRIVIEEKLVGEELSLLMFCDGKRLVPMPASRDHKRRLDGDRGPNTGGMGAFSPVELYKACKNEIETQVLAPLRRALQSRTFDYQGVLYAGLMIEPKGGNGGERIYQPYVLEFNARFGDPETQALLPLLNSDLLPILWACTEGKLHELEIEWSKQASCCVVAAADTYPESGSKDERITLPKAAMADCHIFQAGTKSVNDGVVTNGGRVLAVTGVDATLDKASTRAYQALAQISFSGMSFRKDIGRGAAASCLSR
jgi:phosphoribosylamine--glycine ligase